MPGIQRRQRTRTTLSLVALCTVLVLAGCGTDDDEPSQAERFADGQPEQREQSWEQPYGETSCAQWLTEMSEGEQSVAASDMLAMGRADSGVEAPAPAELEQRFRDGLDRGCRADGVEQRSIAEVGATLYVVGGADGGGEWLER